MVRVQVLAQCVSVLLWLACSTHAQPPAKEREVFFETLREFMPHKELFDLVEHATIREQIGLSESEANLIVEHVSQTSGALNALRKQNEGKNVPLEQYKKQVRAIITPQNIASYDILYKSDFKRLLGIYVQARSYRAVLNEQVAREIGLEGQAFEEFRKTRNEVWQVLMEELREDMMQQIRKAPPGAPPARANITKLFKDAEKELDFKLARELTPDQKEALENLKGAPFNLPEHPFKFPLPPDRGRSGRVGGPPRSPNHGDDHKKAPDKKGDQADAQDHRCDPAKCSDGSHGRTSKLNSPLCD
jgi:hypothetical protein